MKSPSRRRSKIIKLSLIGLAAALTMWLFLERSNLENTLDLRGAVGTNKYLEETRQQMNKDGKNMPDVDSDNLTATLTTLSPKFSGRDDDNLSWHVSADAAHHGAMNDITGTITLDMVEAIATTASGSSLTFLATQGSYTRDNNTLKLTDDVIISGVGLTLSAEEVESELNSKHAWSNKPVKISSSAGELIADTMEILHNGETIRLEGGVKGTLFAASPTTPISNTEEQIQVGK